MSGVLITELPVKLFDSSAHFVHQVHFHHRVVHFEVLVSKAEAFRLPVQRDGGYCVMRR